MGFKRQIFLTEEFQIINVEEMEKMENMIRIPHDNCCRQDPLASVKISG